MSDWIDKVHGFADGELSTEESAEVSQKLTEDSRATAEYQWAVYLRSMLRTKCDSGSCSEEWDKARARLDAIDAVSGDSRVESFVGRWSWGLAACLFAIILFAGFMGRGGSSDLSGQQLAGLLGNASLSQEVTDKGEADRILGSQMGAVNAKVKIVNVAQGKVEGHNFAKISLLDSTGPLVLAIIDQAKGFEGLESVSGRKEYVGGMLNGTNCVGWSMDGRAFLLSAERSTDELLSVCDQIRYREAK